MPKRKTGRRQDGLYERQDSPYYWATYTDAGGKRIRRSTGIHKTAEGRREAEALLSKWRLEAHMEQKWGEQPSRTFDELMVAYLDELEKMARSTERHLWSLKKLKPVFTGKDLNRLTPRDIRQYVLDRRKEGASNGTINREIGLLSSAINHARKEWDWEIPNPCERRRLKEPEGRVRWISRREATVLVEAAKQPERPPYLADFILLALNTGCRRGELLGLEWSRVDLKSRLIRLDAEHTKTKRRRSIPLNEAARQAILRRLQFRMRFCPESPWVICNQQGSRINDIKKTWATVCKKAGLVDFRVHDLRHTCAAWLVTSGVPLAEVRDLLGHSTIAMTERYAHLAPENIRSAVARLDNDTQQKEGTRHTKPPAIPRV